MATLEEKIGKLKTKESAVSPKQFTWPDEALFTTANEVSKQMFVGVADILGLPKVGADFLRSNLGYEEESGLPSGQEIQKFMADWGITYAPGEEPEDIPARFWRNIGASILPIAKIGKAGQWANIAIREGLASFGGAAGGKGLEATSWGQQHPMLARAVGELGGGLSLSSTSLLKRVQPLSMIGLGLLRKPFKGAWAKKRATKRMADVATERQFAAKEYEAAAQTPEFEGLTPAQKTGDRGIASLRKRIEADIPQEAEAGLRQRATAMGTLEARAIKPGSTDIVDVRRHLDKEFKRIAMEADEAMRNIKVGDEVAYNKTAKSHIDEAYSIARQKESKVWQALPPGKSVNPSRLREAYVEEYKNITEGGDIKEIDAFVKLKLGRMNKKGVLVGGELIHAKKSQASPKALHQFYSRLGRRIRELSESRGQTNKIRILGRLRAAVLDDLDNSLVGEKYREAIRFSRELNEMFTSGSLGKVLGFQVGSATPASMFLDDLLGAGDQKAVEGIQQALKAAPQVESQVTNLIRTRFALATKNATNNRINRNAANVFMQKYRRILNAFPDLKGELTTAAQKQSDIDSLMGATNISDMSPLVRERAATAVFLGADPGDEISRVLKFGKSKGKTTQFLTDLVREAKKDPTGKASSGLKNAFVSELLENSRKASLEDPLSGELFISGKAFLAKLNNLASSATSAGLITGKELGRLRNVGKALRNIEIEMAAKPAERLIVDKPGVALETVARLFGARYGAKLGGVSPGGQIQSAGIGAGFSKFIANKITKDEARILLVQATKDDKLMSDLLKDVSKLSKGEQVATAQRIINKAKDMSGRAKVSVQEAQAAVTAIVPPLVSAAKIPEEQRQIERLKNKLDMLQAL